MRIAGEDISGKLNRMYCELASSGLNDDLWYLVADYIGRLAIGLVHYQYVDELLSDALLQTFISIPKFRPHSGDTSFSRWIYGIVRFRAKHLARTRGNDKLVPISQLESPAHEYWNPDDIFGAAPEYDPDLLEEWFDRLDQIDLALDQVRSLLEGDDVAMFDLLRCGNSDYKTGRLMGLTQYQVRRRIIVWERMARAAHIAPAGYSHKRRDAKRKEYMRKYNVRIRHAKIAAPLTN